MNRSRVIQRFKIVITTLSWALALYAFDLIASQQKRYDLFFPRPTTLLHSLITDRSLLLPASLTTITEVIFGLLLGLIVATTLSAAGIWFPQLQIPLRRLSMRSQAIPIPLVMPLLGLSIGYTFWSVCIVIALICFFPTYLGWEQGKMALPTEITILTRSYQPVRTRYIRYILLPSALPYALLGAKGAINLAVLGAVIAEFGSAGDGLGLVILRSIRSMEPARSWAAMVILLLAAGALTTTCDLVIKRLHYRYPGVLDESTSS